MAEPARASHAIAHAFRWISSTTQRRAYAPVVPLRRTWLLAITLASCTPERVATTTSPQTPKPAPKAPPAEPARWVFVDAIKPSAELDLGDGARLSVSADGRRTLLKNGEARDASTLIPGELVAARAIGDSMSFLARDGSTFVTATPLGPLRDRRAFASEKFGAVVGIANGKSSFLVATDANAIVRSTDGGATWTKASLPPLGTRHLDAVAMLPSGDGLALSYPQHLLLTRDDGATWTPLATPSIGARLLHVEEGALELLGLPGLRARLETTTYGFKVEDAGAPKKPKFLPLAMKPHLVVAPAPRESVVLAGGMATFEQAREPAPHWTVTWSTPGAPNKTTAPGTLAPCVALSRPAAHASTIAVACELASHETLVLESDDLFATTREVLRAPGAPPRDAALALGPDGWMFIAPFCNEDDGKCGAAKVRVAGAPQIVDIQREKPFEHVTSIALDVARERAVIVSFDATDHVNLDVASFRQAKLQPLAYVGTKELPILGFGDDGTLRGFVQRNDGGLDAFTIANDGSVTARVALPDLRTADFAGAHGLALGGGFAAWETADGGATWTRVPGPKSVEWPTCSAAGCVVARGVGRIGWDLPATAPRNDVTSAVPAKAAPTPPSATPRAPIACKPKGGWKTLKRSVAPEVLDPAPGIAAYAASSAFDFKASALVVPTKGDAKEVQLLSLPLPDTGKRLGTMRVVADRGGVVAYALSFETVEPGEAYKPVSVQAGWIDAKGAVHHAKTTTPPFRVSLTAGAPDAGLSIDGDGLLLHPDVVAPPLLAFTNAGAKSTLEWPLRAPDDPHYATDVRRLPDGRLLAAHLSSDVELSVFAPDTKSWTKRVWSLGDGFSGEVQLDKGAAPSLVHVNTFLAAEDAHADVFDLASLGADPPAPVRVPLRALFEGSAPSCDASAAQPWIDVAWPDVAPEQLVRVEGLGPEALAAKVDRAALRRSSKDVCIAVRAARYERSVVVLASEAPDQALLIEETDDAARVHALTCTL